MGKSPKSKSRSTHAADSSFFKKVISHVMGVSQRHGKWHFLSHLQSYAVHVVTITTPSMEYYKTLVLIKDWKIKQSTPPPHPTPRDQGFENAPSSAHSLYHAKCPLSDLLHPPGYCLKCPWTPDLQFLKGAPLWWENLLCPGSKTNPSTPFCSGI